MVAKPVRRSRRGRPTAVSERSYLLRSLLLGHYESDPRFLSVLRATYGRHQRLLAELFQKNPQAVGSSLPELAWRSFGPECRDYQADVAAICADWGLRCSWAPSRFHAYFVGAVRLEEWGLAKLGVRPSLSRPPFFRSRSVYSIRVEAPFMPGTERETLKEITKQSRRQMREVVDGLDGDGYVRRDTEPELREHVVWLYLHICPQEDLGRPWGWSRIATDRGVSLFTVRNSVRALAKELDIKLPHLPGGAPRRAPNRTDLTKTLNPKIS